MKKILTMVLAMGIGAAASAQSNDQIQNKKGADLEEKIYAIKTLGINGSDEAISALVAILTSYNDRSVSGLDITYADEDVIREIINTLGDSGHENANGILTEVQFSGYSNGIIRKAKEALKKLN